MGSTTPDAWDNVGPLTTIFTPPPSCSRTFIYYTNDVEYTKVEANAFETQCYPSMSSKEGIGLYGRYYSPGLCPSGWYSAYDYSAMFHGGPTLASGESVAICCPSGYTPTFEPIPPPRLTQGRCESILRSKVTVQACGMCSTSSSIVDTTNAINGKRMTAAEATLMIRWQASDLSVLSAAAASASRTSTSSMKSTAGPTDTGITPTISEGTLGTDSTNPGTTETITGSGPLNSSSTGLSTPAKAGIGVGIAAVVILAILFLAVFLLRRKKKNQKQSPPPDEDGLGELHEDTVHKAELPVSADHLGAKELETEAPDHGPKELAPSGPPKAELPVEEAAVLATPELPADTHRISELQGQLVTPTDENQLASPMPAELDATTANYHASTQAREQTGPVSAESVSSRPVAFYSPTENIDEYARLQEEETRLAGCRSVLQETLALIQEDERLRAEQDAVRRRLEELRKGS